MREVVTICESEISVPVHSPPPLHQESVFCLNLDTQLAGGNTYYQDQPASKLILRTVHSAIPVSPVRTVVWLDLRHEVSSLAGDTAQAETGQEEELEGAHTGRYLLTADTDISVL